MPAGGEFRVENWIDRVSKCLLYMRHGAVGKLSCLLRIQLPYVEKERRAGLSRYPKQGNVLILTKIWLKWCLVVKSKTTN
jgi:hypothetical protein